MRTTSQGLSQQDYKVNQNYYPSNLVVRLPNQPNVGFKQYVDVDVKARRSKEPGKKPLTLWLNRVGEHPYAETFGDSLNLTIPDPGLSTITNVCGAVKCVVIVISGHPIVIQPYVASIDALVAAWLP
ncbi:PREDICTED: beta-glucosidase [Prunus dulcis]|uniref:PREDICTED: beta-glucosidase n=1 Tax=Prunus dulcis TaxID=3755 RepID=A0A5E4G392_PRUDU|nr:PREDICTED: beta-glucosidase [Prunus dulcis]